MKTKNIKLRSFRMREVGDDQEDMSTITTLSSVSNSNTCHYYNCEKGPDLKVMTLDQFPIDSATFTKISNNQYKIDYTFNSKINDGFRISVPFSSSSKVSESDINKYIELRKKSYSPVFPQICRCTDSFFLRNMLLSGEIDEGFINENKLTGAVIGQRDQIVLPVSFIVFNQQGLYFYLNVDQNSNVTFSPT